MEDGELPNDRGSHDKGGCRAEGSSSINDKRKASYGTVFVKSICGASRASAKACGVKGLILGWKEY